MKTKIAYKLTNKNLQTRDQFQWVLNQWYETSGRGDLCSAGWLHFYSHPLLAVFLNPIYGDFKNPRLFRAEVAGEYKTDNGLKCGYSKARIVKELKLPKITLSQRVAFGILCSLKVYKDADYVRWAKGWLTGKDRSYKAAARAARAAEDARVARAARAALAAARAAAETAYAARVAEDAEDAAAYAPLAAVNAARAAVNAAVKPLDLIKIAKKAMTY